jgi:protocatechuate 4,5-dioxygenase alpha chain
VRVEKPPSLASEASAPIPGTYVFDGAAAARGHNLNRMVSSLAKAENRERFAADEDAYVTSYGLSPEQSAAFKRRDWLELIRMGGNIYYIYKLTAIEHMKMSEVGAIQAGLTHDAFLALLRSRGNT